jgi:hypothetical protein
VQTFSNQTTNHHSKDSQTVFLAMILSSQCFIESLWIAKQWVFDYDGHLSIHQTPSPHTHSWTFTPWKVKTNGSSLTIPLDSPTWTFELAKPLDVVLTLNQKKFIRSCLCELLSDLRAMLALCFIDPKTSWPSKWNILLVKEDLLVCLMMALAICDGSPNWLVRHSFNSSLPRPSPHIPPFKYT